MKTLLAEGSLPDMVLGKADAPVTIVEYASMTCPHCAHFHETTLPAIKEKYIDTGKVRFILREFPFDPRAAAGLHAGPLRAGRAVFPAGRCPVQAAGELGQLPTTRAPPLLQIAQTGRFYTGELRGLLDEPEASG